MKMEEGGRKVKEVLSLLSKEGTIKILRESGSKLTSRRDTPSSLGLSRRQYYTRLRDLKRLGMVRKEGEGYIRTENGEKIYSFIKQFLGSGNGWGAELADFSPDGMRKTRSTQKGSALLDVIVNYKDLANRVTEIIKNSEDQFRLASNYMDARVIKAILEAEDKVNVKLLTRKFKIERSVEVFKSIYSPTQLKKAIEISKNQAKIVPKLPFSFITSDKEIVAMEVPDPFRVDQFSMAVVIKNETMNENLRNLFDDLFEMANEPPISKELTNSTSNYLEKFR